MKTVELYVDVDINPDANYGVSVGAPQTWPGGEGARKMLVQTDLDWDRFIRLYVERVTRARPAASAIDVTVRARGLQVAAPEDRHDRC